MYRSILADRQILGIHAASSGLFAELEKFDHFPALFRLHFKQDFRSAFFRKVAQQVGGGIRFHLLHNLSRTIGIEGFNNRFFHFGIDFFQGLGGHALVECLEDGFAFIRSQVFYDIGNVGGVKPG